MFTGLIEEVGRITSIVPFGGGKRISVTAGKIMDDLKIDDSVAIDGVCQTVISVGEKNFTVEAVEETLKKTTLISLKQGKTVNLERAAKLGDRLGGHLVQGHVDCRGRIISIGLTPTDRQVWISFPVEFGKYLVDAGSICVNGISLTTARVEKNKFMVSIIPHTWKVTACSEVKAGSEVNLEFDIIGKYISKLTAPYTGKENIDRNILENYLDQPDI